MYVSVSFKINNTMPSKATLFSNFQHLLVKQSQLAFFDKYQCA